MKAPSCIQHRVLKSIATLLVTFALSHCAMPPQQAWNYIQSNGLLTYWRYEAGEASPPFGTGDARSTQLYASRQLPASARYGPAPMVTNFQPRQPYSAPAPYAQNRYYSPSPTVEQPRVRSLPRPSRPSPSTSSPPRVMIPIEEPAPTFARNEAAQKAPPAGPAASAGSPLVDASPAAATDMPFGTPIQGRVNMVNSPFAGKTQLVDVSGMSPGQTVKCPYTGKLFKVPASQQAENKVETKTESPESKADKRNP